MTKKISARLACACIFMFLLQSCVKDNPFHGEQPDKLLLSKVTGQFVSPYFYGLNSWAYNTSGNLSMTYAYGNDYHLPENPLQKIDFINTGSWNFTYDHFFPFKTIDNSVPGVDQGYWEYYKNYKGLIGKTGLAFKIAEQPRDFEFYTYDKNNNLTTLIYGKAIDTSIFKIVYDYDSKGRLQGYTYYYPIGYSDAVAARASSGNGKLFNSTLKNPGNPIENKITKRGFELMRRPLNTFTNVRTLPADDSKVIYALAFTAKITSDYKNNPFNQQSGLLFYQTNRFYSFNLTDFYLNLIKENPVKVEYALDLGDGTFLNATQTFTYTYNKWNYPVTIHEEMNDPDGLDHSTYTQDKQIEYVKNH